MSFKNNYRKNKMKLKIFNKQLKNKNKKWIVTKWQKMNKYKN